MSAVTTNKVLVAAKFQNIEDIALRERGMLSPNQVRTIEVTDALVDTGASGLLLPKRCILQLGLRQMSSRTARGSDGKVAVPVYSPVELTIHGRICSVDVGKIADEMPILIGRLPLHALDWVVDTKNQRLIGNPEHGGEWIMDIF